MKLENAEMKMVDIRGDMGWSHMWKREMHDGKGWRKRERLEQKDQVTAPAS